MRLRADHLIRLAPGRSDGPAMYRRRFDEPIEEGLRRSGAGQADGGDLDAGMAGENSLGTEGGHRAIRVRLRPEQLQPSRRRPSRMGILADRLYQHAGRYLADIVALTGAVGTSAQGLGPRGVLIGAKPVLHWRAGGREGQEHGRERQGRTHAHGCALQVGWEVQAERSRSKYQGSWAASTCEAGMVTVAGRRNAKG